MKEKQNDILDELEKQSPEWKEAVTWVREHINIVDWLSRGEEAPKEELEEIKRAAIEKKDYVLAAICIYKEKIDEENQ